LIISAPSKSHRWNIEKEVWKLYMHNHPNIDCFFLECDQHNHTENDTIYSKCQESFRPGILLKTIKSLQEMQNKYDFYVRTNLSTFFIFDRLYKDLIHLPRNKIIYTGKRIFNIAYDKTTGKADKKGNNIKFIGGTVVILNNLANNFFLKHIHELSSLFPILSDDSLIGLIFQTYQIAIYRSKHIRNLYMWNNEESIENNIAEINSNNNSYLRTREITDKEITFEKLLRNFYKIEPQHQNKKYNLKHLVNE
jgi:hypothetical protein